MDKIYIVMDYVEHDLKSLMETMKQPFLVGEQQLNLIHDYKFSLVSFCVKGYYKYLHNLKKL